MLGCIEGNGCMNVRLRSVAVITAVVLIDRLTKIYIRNAFSNVDLKPVIPGFFNIVHTENPGAAFGMLANSPGAWRGFFLVGVSFIVMMVIAAMLWKPPAGMSSSWVTTGLALVFGG